VGRRRNLTGKCMEKLGKDEIHGISIGIGGIVEMVIFDNLVGFVFMCFY
jgi:hypothetical protein